MQQSGNSALAAVVEGDRRYIVYKVEIDWNKNGLYNHAYSNMTKVVRSLTTGRDIISALPQEVTLVEGFYTGQMTLRLEGTRPGDTMPVAALFSPWRTDSPLYEFTKAATPIRAFIGHRMSDGTEVQLPQFTGVISDVDVNSGRMEVGLICNDRSELIQNDISLPMYALPPDYSTQTNSSLLYKMNSQWVIDYIFRQNGFYMTPPPQSGCMWSATMHGSPVPELGHQAYAWTGIGVCREEDPVSWPGRPGWGLGYGGSDGYYLVTNSLTTATAFVPRENRSISIQCQADASRAANVHSAGGYIVGFSSGNGYMQGASFVLRLGPTGQIHLDIFKDMTQVTTVNGPNLGTNGWVNVWARLNISNSYLGCTVDFPGMTVTGVHLLTLNDSTISTYPTVTTFAHFPVSDIQICDATGKAAGATVYDPATWVPQVELDEGLNELTGIPLRRGVKSWDLLKEVVGAEYGVLGFTEEGKPFFRNRNTVRKQNLVAEKVISRKGKMADFGMSEQAGAVRNVVTATLAERKITGLNSAEGWEVVYEHSNPTDFWIYPGTTQVDLTLKSPQPILNRVNLTQYTTAQWTDQNVDTDHGFVTVTQSNGAITTGVSASVLPLNPGTIGPDRVRIFFINTNPTLTLKLATTNGDPAFRIQGRPYYFDPPKDYSLTRPASITRFGRRVLDLPDSDWRQMPAATSAIMTSLLRDLQRPVPVVDQITIPGDARMQLQDTLEISDPGFLGGPMYTTLVGLQRSLEINDRSARLTDRINVRPFGAPGQWILGHPVWSVLAATTEI